MNDATLEKMYRGLEEKIRRIKVHDKIPIMLSLVKDLMELAPEQREEVRERLKEVKTGNYTPQKKDRFYIGVRRDVAESVGDQDLRNFLLNYRPVQHIVDPVFEKVQKLRRSNNLPLPDQWYDV